VATSIKLGVPGTGTGSAEAAEVPRPFFSVADLVKRWHCSRASVRNYLRGEKVINFSGRKGGHVLVPLETVLKIERERLRVLR
jgi:hypothetical protein